MMKLARARFPLFMLIQTECSHVVRTQMNEYFSYFFFFFFYNSKPFKQIKCGCLQRPYDHENHNAVFTPAAGYADQNQNPID